MLGNESGFTIHALMKFTFFPNCTWNYRIYSGHLYEYFFKLIITLNVLVLTTPQRQVLNIWTRVWNISFFFSRVTGVTLFNSDVFGVLAPLSIHLVFIWQNPNERHTQVICSAWTDLTPIWFLRSRVWRGLETPSQTYCRKKHVAKKKNKWNGANSQEPALQGSPLLFK